MDPWGFLPSPLRQLQATESPLQKTRWMILEEQHLWLSFGLYTPSTPTQKCFVAGVWHQAKLGSGSIVF